MPTPPAPPSEVGLGGSTPNIPEYIHKQKQFKKLVTNQTTPDHYKEKVNWKR